MGTSLKLMLDDRREKSDGTFPLIIRLYHESNSTSIPLEINVKKEDWDDKKKQLRKSCKSFIDLSQVNFDINKAVMDINQHIHVLRSSNQLLSLSISQLKKIVTNQSDDSMFCEYAERLADTFEKTYRLGNAAIYRYTISFVKRNNKDQDIPFSHLTYDFLKKIELDYLSKGKSVNGLSVYFRTIRSIYNKAVKEGIVKDGNNPFRFLEIRKAQTRKRAISRELIQKIEELEVPEGSIIWHSKNYFLFSFYCRGMNFIDIAKLQVKNLIDGKVIYARSKSRDKKIFSITITDKIRNILDLYMKEIDVNDPKSYIFPIVKRTDPILQRKDIENTRGLFNDYLKKIAKACGITDNLTSYVARHTWASSAKKLRIPTEIISEGMGHSDVKTTQIYLENFDDDVLDEANRRITD